MAPAGRLVSMAASFARAKFQLYPIGHCHVDLAEVRTGPGTLYLLVTIDWTSESALVELHEKVTRPIAGASLRHLAAGVPYHIMRCVPITARFHRRRLDVRDIKEMRAQKLPFQSHAF